MTWYRTAGNSAYARCMFLSYGISMVLHRTYRLFVYSGNIQSDMGHGHQIGHGLRVSLPNLTCTYLKCTLCMYLGILPMDPMKN